MKYLELAMFTESEKFDAVRKLLKEEFGLIAPKPRSETGFIAAVEGLPDLTEKRKLVYTKDGRWGVYRVEFKEEHCDGPHVYFRYWRLLLTPETEEQDPMLDAVRKIYDLVKPKKCVSCEGGFYLEEIVGIP